MGSARWLTVFVFIACSASLLPADSAKPEAPTPRLIVRPISDDFRKSLKLDPFYQKQTDYKGLPILASGKVSDEALAEARYLIGQVLAKRDDVTAALVKNRCRFVVMAPTEKTTDVPEQRNMTPKDYWDNRARGLGGRITSCGEENLLNLKGDRYRNENILIHEFGHCIHQYGLKAVEPKFDGKLRATYARAVDKGLWKDTYAATNHSEYWAEGVQSYFDCNAPPNKGVHNDINTREKLAKYDTELFELIDDAFKQSEYRYVRYDKRKQTK
jgi:alpha-glucosidase